MPQDYRRGGLVTAARVSVAVLGAGGTIGLEMARNLARAGMDVRGWNRTPDRAAPLAADGVRLAGSPAEVARGPVSC